MQKSKIKYQKCGTPHQSARLLERQARRGRQAQAGTHSRSPDTISSSADRLVQGDFLNFAFCTLVFELN
jgi:hypothetical protein